MTSEQKKAIDACKDQAAKEFPDPLLLTRNFDSWEEATLTLSVTNFEHVVYRAMQLYGEQCAKEAVKHSWVNYLGDYGKTCPCHLCGEQTFGTYDGKPSCLRCAIRLKCQ